MGPSGQKLDLAIIQGKTFFLTLRWATEPYIYKPITDIERTAPLRMTVPAHGMPDGWRFAVAGVKGMTALNAKSSPPAISEYYEATVVDQDLIEVNHINGLLLQAYTGDGVIQYLTPVTLAGMSARMSIKDRIGGTRLAHLTSDAGDIELNSAQSTITLRLPPTVTEAFDWRRGVYDLEIYNANDVYLLTYGAVSVEREVTVNG